MLLRLFLYIVIKKVIDKFHKLFTTLTPLKGQFRFFKWSGIRYLSKVSVFPTVDISQHAPSLERQTGVLEQKLSNVMLWTGSA